MSEVVKRKDCQQVSADKVISCGHLLFKEQQCYEPHIDFICLTQTLIG